MNDDFLSAIRQMVQTSIEKAADAEIEKQREIFKRQLEDFERDMQRKKSEVTQRLMDMLEIYATHSPVGDVTIQINWKMK